jgi:hypothetical protein
MVARNVDPSTPWWSVSSTQIVVTLAGVPLL